MIQRIGCTERWSDAVIHNNTLYMVEVPANTEGNITQQSIELLNMIERGLESYGSHKSKILSATIYLKDINLIGEFNAIWDNWLPSGSAPSRACIEANLAHQNYLVEIQLVAAI